MAHLQDKIQNALDESRILILGSQVLIGFQFRSFFESGFERLPAVSKQLSLAALGILLFTLALLLWPAAFHRIVQEGEDTREVHAFTTVVMSVALLPFAVGLGIEVYVITRTILHGTASILLGGGILLLALFLWYIFEWMHRHSRKEQHDMANATHGTARQRTEITNKIRHVLTEARMVLPGGQTLLGFQFITMLMDQFEKLPQSSQYIHLACLLCTAVSIVLLMTPAAYHRLVERGEETAEFHRFASRVLLLAMMPLAISVCGDLFVVLRKVTNDLVLSITVAVGMLALFYGLWFGYTLFHRARLQGANARSGNPAVGAQGF
jgi:hypothetical protein